MYTPDWGALAHPKVWLAATGQIFFTLSVGMGSLQAYASYLTKKDDIVLSGIATSATNETAEVVLGGSLAIPAVVTFFGVSGAVAIAKGGSFDLGFIAMPLVFNNLPGGAIMTALAGIMWFGLLFFAGITSSVSMITPCQAFLQENFGLEREEGPRHPVRRRGRLGALPRHLQRAGLPGRVGLLGGHLRAGHPGPGRNGHLRLDLRAEQRMERAA